MEEILVNIDSRYRDTISYPNETKFRYTLEKSIKNVTSIKLVSLEVNNSINYISATRKNNYFTVHLPNKINDPTGTRIEMENGLLQLIASINNMINSVFSGLFNKNSSLQAKLVGTEPIAEKYFYIFYLNNNVQFTFNFNAVGNMPSTLQNPLIIEAGWNSIYGIVIQIKNYITAKYNERKTYKTNNPSDVSTIPLDNGNFEFSNGVTFDVWDRRFRNVTTTTYLGNLYYQPTATDCIRSDVLPVDNYSYNSNNLATNLETFKNDFYKFYIYDTINFIVAKSTADYPSMSILDKLNTSTYVIPSGYIGAGTDLLSKSVYHLNNTASEPTLDSTQIYNLNANTNLTSLRVNITNNFTKASTSSGSSADYFYYYIDIRDGSVQTWSTADSNNTTGNLVTKDFLLYNGFITIDQYNNAAFKPSMVKDIAEFNIDFNTYTDLNTYVINGMVDIHKMQYPPLGFYLGFRPDMTKATDKFLARPVWLDSDVIIEAPKMFSTTGDSYIFIRINDYGYIDFFNRTMFGKILMTTGLGNPKIDDGLSKEYRFRQPINLQRFDIELVDYLGNTLDLNGNDYSMTLEIKTYVNSTQKVVSEKQALVFG